MILDLGWNLDLIGMGFGIGDSTIGIRSTDYLESLTVLLLFLVPISRPPLDVVNPTIFSIVHPLTNSGPSVLLSANHSFTHSSGTRPTSYYI